MSTNTSLSSWSLLNCIALAKRLFVLCFMWWSCKIFWCFAFTSGHLSQYIISHACTISQTCCAIFILSKNLLMVLFFLIIKINLHCKEKPTKITTHWLIPFVNVYKRQDVKWERKIKCWSKPNFDWFAFYNSFCFHGTVNLKNKIMLKVQLAMQVLSIMK